MEKEAVKPWTHCVVDAKTFRWVSRHRSRAGAQKHATRLENRTSGYYRVEEIPHDRGRNPKK